MVKATVLASLASLATGHKCCETCPGGQQKYYSVDTKHGHCGETCIQPSSFRDFKIFEPNLTIADGSTGYTSCADLGWPKYTETVTHGDPLKILTCTLDLYDPGDFASQGAGYPDDTDRVNNTFETLWESPGFGQELSPSSHPNCSLIEGSRECKFGKTYHCDKGQVWITGGCHGEFICDGDQLECHAGKFDTRRRRETGASRRRGSENGNCPCNPSSGDRRRRCPLSEPACSRRRQLHSSSKDHSDEEEFDDEEFDLDDLKVV